MGDVLRCPGPQPVCSVFEDFVLFTYSVQHGLVFHWPLTAIMRLYAPYNNNNSNKKIYNAHI